MLMVVDVGNSTIECGLVYGQEIVDSFRFQTYSATSIDSLTESIDRGLEGTSRTLHSVREIAVSSVVPDVTKIVSAFTSDGLRQPPVILDPSMPLGLTLEVEQPEKVGMDRILGALAARAHHRQNCIVADIGTAVTVDAVSKDDSFLGGAIAPGPGLSAEALTERSPLLSFESIEQPSKVVGQSTEEALRSGIVHGLVGQVEKIITEVQRELGWEDPAIVVTGGFGELFSRLTSLKVQHCPLLVLEGISIAFDNLSEEFKV